jgi:hypothetical protein
MSKNTKLVVIASDEALLAGLNKRFPNLAIMLAGQSYTTQTLGAVIQKRITDNKASDTAHTAWLGSCATAKVTMEQSAPVIHAFEQYVRSQYGQDTTALGDFGLKPTRTGVKSAKTKAQAAEKSAATRKGNNTMGSAQRKAADKAAEQAAPVHPVTSEPAVPPAVVTTSKQ